MEFKPSWIICAIALLTIFKASAQTTDSVIVYLSIANAQVTKGRDMELTVTIESMSRRPLIIVHPFTWGFLHDSIGTGYFSIELEKNYQGGYTKVPLNAIVDNGGPLDPDTLKLHEKKEGEFPMFLFFNPTEGDYRVRVLCFIGADNPQIPSPYSNWVYFHCSKDYKR
jgi:hypothetical protein